MRRALLEVRLEVEIEIPPFLCGRGARKDPNVDVGFFRAPLTSCTFRFFASSQVQDAHCQCLRSEFHCFSC